MRLYNIFNVVGKEEDRIKTDFEVSLLGDWVDATYNFLMLIMNLRGRKSVKGKTIKSTWTFTLNSSVSILPYCHSD